MRTIEKIEGYVASEKGQQTIMSGLDRSEQDIALSLISLRDNEYIQKMSSHWQTLSDKDKKSIYEGGSMSLWSTTKRIVFTKSPIYRAVSVLLGKKTISHELFDSFSVLTRVLVHFGILDKPVGISDDDLRKNIADDAKGIGMQFTAVKGLCTIVPELRPALPFIKRAEPFVVLGTIAQERIAQAVVNTPKKDVIATGTDDALYTAFSEAKDPYAEAA